jgi:hypothetical protein
MQLPRGERSCKTTASLDDFDVLRIETKLNEHQHLSLKIYLDFQFQNCKKVVLLYKKCWPPPVHHVQL